MLRAVLYLLFDNTQMTLLPFVFGDLNIDLQYSPEHSRKSFDQHTCLKCIANAVMFAYS